MGKETLMYKRAKTKRIIFLCLMVWFWAQSHDLGIMTSYFQCWQHWQRQYAALHISASETTKYMCTLVKWVNTRSYWCVTCIWNCYFLVLMPKLPLNSHKLLQKGGQMASCTGNRLLHTQGLLLAHLPAAKGKGKPSEEHTADRATVCGFLSAGCSGRMPQSDFYRILLLSLCWSKLHVLNISVYMPILSWIVFSHVCVFFLGGRWRGEIMGNKSSFNGINCTTLEASPCLRTPCHCTSNTFIM